MGAAAGGNREPALENLRWRKIPGSGGAWPRGWKACRRA